LSFHSVLFLQQEEQKLCSLRVEAASQGFRHIILCGTGQILPETVSKTASLRPLSSVPLHV
jgi:hypothetical protein